MFARACRDSVQSGRVEWYDLDSGDIFESTGDEAVVAPCDAASLLGQVTPLNSCYKHRIRFLFDSYKHRIRFLF